MAVQSNWYLAITWRKSTFSGESADCVQVARYERPAPAGSPREDFGPEAQSPES